jgi:hypothetical protein
MAAAPAGCRSVPEFHRQACMRAVLGLVHPATGKPMLWKSNMPEDMAEAGVSSIHGGGACTFEDRERYFSYRRDGVTGRMATLIWRDDEVGV